MISMRSAIIIFAASFLICIIFLSSPNSGNYSQAVNILDNKGRVLGAQEVIAEISLKDLGIDLNALPQSEGVTVKEPEKIKPGSDFKLQNCFGAVIDIETNKLLYSKDANRIVPIASITKLATALVFLDNNPGWERIHTVSNSDMVGGGRIYLVNGDKVKIRDLFYLSLIGSANSATEALVNSTLLSEEEFINKMNIKADELSLYNTRFVDPVGLSRENVSTALEVARLAQAAMEKDEISLAVKKKTYEFFTESGAKRSVSNTNLLLFRYPQESIGIIGGKTGYTKLAGYCFVGKFKDSSGQEVVSAVLGSDNQNFRFSETERLISWVYDNYRWP